jgi:putative transposase
LHVAQYASIWFTDRLIEHGIDPYVGSIGGACERPGRVPDRFVQDRLIRPHGSWTGIDDVEPATLDWVHWFNHERTHDSMDDLTPVEVEAFHYSHHRRHEPAA